MSEFVSLPSSDGFGQSVLGRPVVGIGILRLIPRTSERAAAAAVSRTEPWSWSAARWRGGRRTRTRRGGRGSGGGGSNLQRGNVLARELERDVVALRRSARKGKGCARGGRDYFVTATDNFRSANVTALFASLSAIF